MTLDNLRASIGLPASTQSCTERWQRTNGELVEWGWRDTARGADHWWWAVTRGGDVLAIGRVPGDRIERDKRLSRAVARLRSRPDRDALPVGEPEARGGA